MIVTANSILGDRRATRIDGPLGRVTRGSGGIGKRPLVTRVDHARPVHPINEYAFEAALVWIAYHIGVRLVDGAYIMAGRTLGRYIQMEGMR